MPVDWPEWDPQEPAEEPPAPREEPAPEPRTRVVVEPDPEADAEVVGKMPPCDLDAERAVLSSILLDPMAMPLLAGNLSIEAFFPEAHRRIFEAAEKIHATGGAVDSVTVASYLKATGRLDQVGGIEGIVAIQDSAPATTRVLEYARTIHDLARVRRMIAWSTRIAAEGYLPMESTQEKLEEIAREADALVRNEFSKRVETNGEVLVRLIREAHGAVTKVPGLSTGLPSHDALTGGLHGGRVTLIGALRGRGKTTFSRQVATHVLRRGVGVHVFCTESSREDWTRGLLSLEAEVDVGKLRPPRDGEPIMLTADESERLQTASDVISRWPLVIDDSPEITPRRILQTVRARMASRRPNDPPLGLVILDYIQRLRADPEHTRMRRYDQLREMAQMIKNGSRELLIPIMVLAQQKNLAVPGKDQDPKPKNDAIAECRAIEAEADDIMFLWRKPRGKFDPPASAGGPQALLGCVTKARHGREGEFDLDAYFDYCKFVDVAEYERMRAASRDFVEGFEGPSDT